MKFQEFPESDTPPYAILSHTWDYGNEVSYQDMSSLYVPSKKGYAKIIETCRLAINHGLEYVWVDTCCIDKTNSGELSEAINSMFRWYQRSQVCFVYLADYKYEGIRNYFPSDCRWLGRGWTLQEMLASSRIHFYDQDWYPLGTKADFATQIERITRIPTHAILGLAPPSSYSVAQRMSWAARRETARIEDQAYSLLGLFDINMPLIYGEGIKAFHRLQEEIIKHNGDLSILAWQPTSSHGEVCSTLADSPLAFQECHDIFPFSPTGVDFSISNRGLKITRQLGIVTRSDGDAQGPLTYGFVIGYTQENPYSVVSIPLKKIGYGLYIRESYPPIMKHSPSKWRSMTATRSHMLCIVQSVPPYLRDSHLPTPMTPTALPPSGQGSYQGAVHIPTFKNIKMIPGSGLPTGAYDEINQISFRPDGTYNSVVAYSFVAKTSPTTEFKFAILFDFQDYRRGPRPVMIDKSSPASKLLYLLLLRHSDEPMSWIDVDEELPEISSLGHGLRFKVDGKTMELSASIAPRNVVLDSKTLEMSVLDVKLEDITESPYQTRALYHH